MHLSIKKVVNHRANTVDSTQALFHDSGIQYSGQVNITSNLSPDLEVGNCMRDLFLTDPYEDREKMKRKKGNRASGTCEWIFDKGFLKNWLHFEEAEQESRSSNVLWLYGDPGTGKSTMAIFLTEKLSTDLNTMENMTLAYFFCDSSFAKQKTATSIVRGLLFQLVQQHRNLLDKYVLPGYKERGNELFVSFDVLWTLFIAAAADQDTGRKYCIIDALDECDINSQYLLLTQLHETFHYQGKAAPNLFILITSRPHPEICQYLDEFMNADLASFDEARQDIDRCITERVNELAKKKRYTDKVQREIADLLRDKAERTFLWVELAYEQLREKPSKDATQFLRNMPRGLTSFYEILLNTALEEGHVAMRRILSFVAVSFDAPSMLGLSEACRLYQDEPDLDTRLQYIHDQIISSRLLVVTQDKKVHFLHGSIRDYLTGPDSNFFVDTLKAHASAALYCIDNLIKRLHGEKTTEGPFRNYASKYWTEHVREAGERFKICEPQIPFFEPNSKSMWRWIQGYDDRRPEYTFLQIASRFGLPILIEYALGMREVYPIMGGSAFNIKIAPNPLHEGDESPLSTALTSISSSSETKTEMVHLLLQGGAIVTGKDMNNAMYKNWVNEEIILSLLDHMIPETRTEYIHELLRNRDERENKFMSLILDKYGDQIKGREHLIGRAVSSSIAMEILPSLFDQKGGRMAITENIMKSAAESVQQGSEVVEFTLKYQGDQTLITERIIIAAMYNQQQGKSIIQSLYHHQSGKIAITAAILETAVYLKQGRECIEILLQGQPTVTITYAMLYMGAKKHGQAREIISLIIQRLGNSINMDDIMITAIRLPYDYAEFIEFLIHEGGPYIVITDELVGAVLDAICYGQEGAVVCMELFFKEREKLKFNGKALATIYEFRRYRISESKEGEIIENQEEISA
ncbi:hypothetical protein HDV62DRAFT_310004 [Trichoderma sp. SZMC 28011]